MEEKLFIYYGGLLEWCLLQDVYDVTNFPTTNKCVDIIRFRANNVINNQKDISRILLPTGNRGIPSAEYS